MSGSGRFIAQELREPWARITGVSFEVGGKRILAEISLTLSENRIGVIGANGSGKSTLLRLLNGLVQPTTGAVEVYGHDVKSETNAVRRLVGFVFSDPESQAVMPTVAEDVDFSLRRFKYTPEERAAKVTELLEAAGLDAVADQSVLTLSSGQKQLLALTAVLATKPKLLVCDEPTTLLDLRHTQAIRRRWQALSEPIVMGTHDLALVEDWERVLVLAEGRVVFDGPGPESVAHYRRSCELTP